PNDFDSDSSHQKNDESRTLVQTWLKNEPCLFPISKLYEAIISNLNHLELFWENITRHFLCECKHTSVKYREWCVDSICNFIRATFNYKYSNNTSESNKTSRDIILQPLDKLSNIQFNDVRQKQIECTLSILRLMGQHLNESWDDLKWEYQVNIAVNKSNRALGMLKNLFKYFNKKYFKMLYSALVRPNLEYAVCVWSTFLKKDVNAVESLQRRATKLVKNIREMPYELRLKELEIQTLVKCRERGDLI
ncbi:unnamed protein product, partial [Brachionus calyciflorus]